MKIYEIADEERCESVGVLLYYEKQKAFIIELQEDLDEWTAPLLFTSLVKKHIFKVPKDISALWVRERVIPSGRQNIGSILTTHKLRAYDEMRFLEISKGKCSQDSLYIRKLHELPAFVGKRMEQNVAECFLSSDHTLMCFFFDGTTRKTDLSELRDADGVDQVLKNRRLMESVQPGVGGYSVSFGNGVDIPAHLLYRSGVSVPVSLAEFQAFVRRNVLDTSESCAILACSRQNLAYLQAQGLAAVKENAKGNLYLKGDILKTRWD